MSYISVDVESDWPCPWMHSMISFGAVVVEESLTRTFYWKLKPISDKYVDEALAVSGFSREETLNFNDPYEVMNEFHEWVEANSIGRPTFVTDNLAYDWQWINYYFYHYCGDNPFWHSWTRINDIYAWMQMDMGARNKWQKFRRTKHTHNPVDDAKWNAEALLYIQSLWLNIKLI